MYIAVIIGWISFFLADDVSFKSVRLNKLSFSGMYQSTGTIKDDTGDMVEVTGKRGDDGNLYWYRRVKTPVCLTGECRLVDIGIYWNGIGDFYGLEVYNEPLTKADHKDFTVADYDKLMSVLENDWSALREYDFTSLSDSTSSVDGVSGATNREIASEAVDQAVYTTYTIWHLAHVGEKEQIKGLTANQLKKDEQLLKRFALQTNQGFNDFVFELLDLGKIKPSPITDSMILSCLRSDDIQFKKMALNSMKLSDVNNMRLQDELAKIYSNSPKDEKQRLLDILSTADSVSLPVCDNLSQDLGSDNDWLLLKILPVLEKCSRLSQHSIERLNILASSDNMKIKTTAKTILSKHK